MAVKIRLARNGKKHVPAYAVIAADSRAPRDGKFLEKIGTYQPKLPKNSVDRIKLKMDRVNHWLSVGAQPTDVVQRLMIRNKSLLAAVATTTAAITEVECENNNTTTVKK